MLSVGVWQPEAVQSNGLGPEDPTECTGDGDFGSMFVGSSDSAGEGATVRSGATTGVEVPAFAFLSPSTVLPRLEGELTRRC